MNNPYASPSGMSTEASESADVPGGFRKCPRCQWLDVQRLSCSRCGYTVTTPAPAAAQRADTIFHKAAYWCAALPVAHIVLSLVYNVFKAGDTDRQVAKVFFAMSFCLLSSSIVCGMIALAGVRQHGHQGITLRAICGTGFSAAIMYVWFFVW